MRAAIGLFIVGLAYVLVGIDRHPNIYDEGLAVYGATRVLAGELLYRDFWTLYGPGNFYFLAISFKVFGTTLMVGRVVSAVLTALLGSLVYLIARLVVSSPLALCAALFWIMRAGSYTGYFSNAIHPALVLTSASILAVGARSGPKINTAGVLAGLAVLLRPDFGLAAFVSGVLGLAVMVAAVSPGERLRTVTRVASRFSIAALAPTVPVAALIVALAGFGEVAQQTIWFPTRVLSVERTLPYPRLIQSDLSEVLKAFPFYLGVVPPAVELG